MTLRARLLVAVVAVAAVLVVTALVITRTTENYLVAQVDAQLTDARIPDRGFGGATGLPPGQGTTDDTGSSVPPERPSDFYVAVVNDGDVTSVLAPNASSDAAPVPEISADQATASARSGEPFTVGSEGSSLRYRVLGAFDQRTGDVVLLGLPLNHVDAAVDRLIAVEVVATLAVLAVLAGTSWFVIHLGVRPIKRMTATATAIAAGDLSLRVPDADPRTEAGELGAALNQMLGRIEDAFDRRLESEARLRQFVADASHELRTPVATIRGYAELYRFGGLTDTTELDDAMRRTEDEAVRMGSLVDDLLVLARLDQGRPLDRQPVALDVLADDAARDARAVDPNRPVTTDIQAPVVVVGDDRRLRQVVGNLVTNALVHTPAGTPVEVRVRTHSGWAVLEVADAGPGMDPDVAGRIFERFYRADPARSRHHGGSGLGLAIVDATVTGHGGRVSVHTAPGAGTTMRVELPLAPAEDHGVVVPPARSL